MNESIIDCPDLDELDCPLSGTCLIEAGAGTGKTYTITSLYLRLILEKGLRVNEILVVTFTKAATEEIKERTRKKLQEGIRAFSRGDHADPFLRALLHKHTDPARALQALTAGLRAFDEAAIFTIHGFCRRMLQENAFETGSLFDTELSTEEGKIREEIVYDFWRRNFYGADPQWVGYALSKGLSPAAFLKHAGWTLLQDELRILPDLKAPAIGGWKPFNLTFERLKEAWDREKATAWDRLMDPGLNGRAYGTLTPSEEGGTHRERKISEWFAGMDRFLATTPPPLSLFKGFEKLTDRTLGSSMKKGCRFSGHPIFTLCQELKDQAESLSKEMDQAILALRRAFFEELKEGLSERKRRKNLRTFDDLLIELREALTARNGTPLLQAVQSKYGAALIDEFQDTDPVQYQIFKTLFGTGPRPLFLIGDPKQAIYSFRGADIFTYMKAAGEVSHRYTLRRNWRSEPNLLTALNALFSSKENPFLYEAIRCPTALAGSCGEETLTIDGKGPAPMQIWLVGEAGDEETVKPLAKEKAGRRITRAVSGEIARLLRLGREGKARIGREPLKERDLAVLVRKNREARIVQEALEELHIRSVLYSSGNLFETREAMEVERILTAVAFPDREPLLRGALATASLGWNGEELDRLSGDETAWEEILQRFGEYHGLWRKQGFMPMVRLLFLREDVGPRLLAYPDGERRMTNMLHLSEVLHRESLERNLGISGVLKWLSDQRNRPDSGLEEHQLRLESDEEAVKIVTIHKSKGLEYPVVFCPFLWEGSEVREGEIAYHDKEHDHCLTLDLGSPEREAHKSCAEEELLAENLRLLYVALTRARNRAYLVWGFMKGCETSAPAYLLHGPRSFPAGQAFGGTRTCFLKMGRGEMLRDLQQLIERSEGTISCSELPGATFPLEEQAEGGEETLSCRTLTRGIPRDFRISSFSSLVSGKRLPTDLPDHDALPSGPREETAPLSEEKAAGILAFPHGSKPGTFLHDLLENLDFQEQDASVLKSFILQKLDQYGFGASWLDALRRMILHLLSTPIDHDNPGLVLKKIGLQDRLNELEFDFPLKRVSAADLARLFEGKISSSGLADFPRNLERLQFAPTRGYMRGFIDLIFRFEGKFYLVDWKSNFLGFGEEDYSQEVLIRTMKREYYVLQYHLYTLALDQYLTLRWPGYRYDRHFGGCYYLFLRGVDPAKGPAQGVFKDIPSPSLMKALHESLIDRG